MTVAARTSSGSPIDAFRLGTVQTANYGATAVAIASGAPANVSVAAVVATSDCHIAQGASPTATASDFFLPANTILYLRVEEGDKFSAIQDAVSGTLYVAWMR